MGSLLEGEALWDGIRIVKPWTAWQNIGLIIQLKSIRTNVSESIYKNIVSDIIIFI